MNIGMIKRGNEMLIPQVQLANNLWSRFKGLLGRVSLNEEQGLLISPCNSIHTMWMRFAIDAVFVDRQGVITSISHDIKPWRLAGCKKATGVLELPAGMASKLSLAQGQTLLWQQGSEQ